MLPDWFEIWRKPLQAEFANIEFAGHCFRLLPSGAIFSVAHQTLWVADLHLGKAATYRQLGQPVPKGTTTATLKQLTGDIEQCQAQQVIVLGDFLHGPLVHGSQSTLQAISTWRAQHAHCAITLIRGNHDDKAGDPPQSLNIRVVDQPFEFETMLCCHDDQAPGLSPHSLVLSGHTHPVVVVHGRARERFRLACFVVSPNRVILPAYGAFTGGHVHKPTSEESIYVIADQTVIKLSGPI